MHLLTHQIHHRGQAHAMLAGTSVKPPQLDEFVMPSESHYRTTTLLHWVGPKPTCSVGVHSLLSTTIRP